eukprot:14070725-Heterocapsa_arctica.AAC.1
MSFFHSEWLTSSYCSSSCRSYSAISPRLTRVITSRASPPRSPHDQLVAMFFTSTLYAVPPVAGANLGPLWPSL